MGKEEFREFEAPVPWDKLLSFRYRFSKPSFDLEETFWQMHLEAEKSYNGDGTWGKTTVWCLPGNPPPNFEPSNRGLIRYTGRGILAYLAAYKVDPREIYKQRAFEGLEFLVRDQCNASTPNPVEKYGRKYDRSVEGAWRFYGVKEGIVSDGTLYIVGIAGRAMVEGYKFFGDPRYLKSSRKGAEWSMREPIHPNTNYNAFAVWHLAAHYGVTGDDDVLESAIHKTRHGIFTGQLENGAWAGHNAWSVYHGINLRGMVELYRVLPADHPFREELYPHIIAAINHMIVMQTESGAVWNCWDLNELSRQVGIRTNIPMPQPKRPTLEMQAMIMADEYLGLDLDEVIFGMIGCYKDVRKHGDEEERKARRQLLHPNEPTMTFAAALEWYAKKVGHNTA